MDFYRLRVVIAGISPLIWRRLEVAADTTVAGAARHHAGRVRLEGRAPAPVRHRRHPTNESGTNRGDYAASLP
jgi:hypothetical protein